jgi:FkbM family methyltransferase
VRRGTKLAGVSDDMRRHLRRPLQSLVRSLIARPAGFRLVNAIHRALGAAGRRRFYYLCCEEARGVRADGEFAVRFAGRPLRLPVSSASPDSWLNAVSFDGHDPELHAVYAAVLRGPQPPRLVFDVGANYGLHALCFLAHGVRVVAFEPNPACHEWFHEACALNRLPCELEGVAVGERADSVVLAFPEAQTYLGSVVPRVQAGWDGARTVTVPQVTLDDVVAAYGSAPDLVKIDTEGAELGVLRGARKLLETARPMLVFESWRSPEERGAIWALLAEQGYAIAAVRAASRALTRAEFLHADTINFVAEEPPGRVIHSARQ